MTQSIVNPFLLILFCLIVWSSPANASTNNDNTNQSYEKLLKELKYSLNQLKHFDSLDLKDSVQVYIKKGEVLCNQIKLSTAEPSEAHRPVADMYDLIASYHYSIHNLAEALIGFQKAADLYKLLEMEYKFAQCLNNVTVIYLLIGNQTEALDLLHKSTSIFIDIKDSNGIALGYNSIANIYRDQKDYQRTQEYLGNALIIGRKLDDADVLSSILNSLASLEKELGNKDEALVLFHEALSISKHARSEMKVALILNNIGVIYKEIGNLEDARINFEQAYKIALKNNSNYGKTFTLVNLSDYYLLKKNYIQAEKLANEAIDIGDKTVYDEAMYKAINVLIKIHDEQNNWRKKAYYQTILIEQKEKREEQIIEQISQQEKIRYKLEKEFYISKNREIEEKLLREKEIQRLNFYYGIFIIVMVLMFAFSLIVYFRLRSSREKNKNITKQSEERKLLLQEVHHRVKNNFQIVSSMLRLQSYNFNNEVLHQNFEEAINRINAMAIVHDVIYRQEKFSDIDAKAYLERLIKVLHKTGDNRIAIEIKSEQIPFKIETLINLGIALNELITNSFKHAFNNSVIQPKISISLLTIADKSYELIYRDNGVGISEDTFNTGFGMELIETIISNFEGDVKLTSEKDWNTVIRITFKEF